MWVPIQSFYRARSASKKGTGRSFPHPSEPASFVKNCDSLTIRGSDLLEELRD